MATWHRFTPNSQNQGGFLNLDYVTRIAALPTEADPSVFALVAYVVDDPYPEALGTTTYASAEDALAAAQNIIGAPYES